MSENAGLETTADEITALRRFNRTVTQRIGALQDDYLSRARPLGASRVLWEVGPEGTDARTLRAELGLDSGYSSRLLRALEREGLIAVAAHPDDNRRRTISLTAAGRREWATLDRDSDALAASLLEPLTAGQRTRLFEAVATVDALLTAGLVSIEMEDPRSADARFCLGSYFAELETRFDSGFDEALTISADARELTEPNGLLLVARLRSQPVGCAALKLHGSEPAEIKRMWVAASVRGLGVGRRLLTELEVRARDRDATVARLETNRALAEAIALYRSAGYVEVDAFNDEPFAHHWFEKRLVP